MTLPAGLNSWQQNISRFVTLDCLRVAGSAGHHAMGFVVEGRVLKPARANFGWNNFWETGGRGL